MSLMSERKVGRPEVPVGSKYSTKQGYIRIKAVRPDGSIRWQREHVVVMERYLGRLLLPHEQVHHKNNVRYDNRLENLELWTKRQPSGQRVDDALAWAREIIDLYGSRDNM